MNLPTSVVITGCDGMDVLAQAVRAAITFAPMPPEEVRRLLDGTRAAAAEGKLETFKTGGEHDGTAQHPHWLDTARL
jgi:hypothetical protein